MRRGGCEGTGRGDAHDDACGDGIDGVREAGIREGGSDETCSNEMFLTALYDGHRDIEPSIKSIRTLITRRASARW